jgi:hypothetical protein
MALMIYVASADSENNSGADLAGSFLIACLGLDFKCTVRAWIVIYCGWLFNLWKVWRRLLCIVQEFGYILLLMYSTVKFCVKNGTNGQTVNVCKVWMIFENCNWRNQRCHFEWCGHMISNWTFLWRILYLIQDYCIFLLW